MKSMRIWIAALPCAYLALIIALVAPLASVAFDVDFQSPEAGGQIAAALADPRREILAELMFSPWTYLWLGSLAGSQVALLLPCGKSTDRPRARRRLYWALIAAAFLAGLLTTCLAAALSFGIWGDAVLDAFDAPIEVNLWEPVAALPFGDSLVFIIAILSPIATAWAIWWWLLYRATRGQPSPSFPDKAARWLIAGSALEFVVAVPCHVAARNRDDCCAPAATFFGLATGMAVALLCCGPALLYLIRDRLRRKRARLRPDDRRPGPL